MKNIHLVCPQLPIRANRFHGNPVIRSLDYRRFRFRRTDNAQIMNKLIIF